MGEVARIVVPIPPALTPVEDGVETRGQAYLLHAPAVATEPMAIQAQTGEILLLAPAELYYRDAAGEWDVLYGSAPVSVSASGRQARYERPWPLGDDVFVAEAERVKHWAVLHRAPRHPAAHLGDGTEFGVAWLVSGVTLPAGRHDRIEAGPFILPNPWAQDTAGERVYGYYEVVDIEEGLQQLYLWLPAEWLLSEERVYPVTVDPTVGTSSSANATLYSLQQHEAAFSNGVRVCVYADSNAIRCRYSTDQGQTWQTPATGGTVYSGSAGQPAVAIAGDRIHVVLAGSEIYYLMGTPTDSDNTAYVWSTPIPIPNEEVPPWVSSVHGAPNIAVRESSEGFRVLISRGVADWYQPDDVRHSSARVTILDVTETGALIRRTTTNPLHRSGDNIVHPTWVGVRSDGSPIVVAPLLGELLASSGTVSGSSYVWGQVETVGNVYSTVAGAALDSQDRAVVAYRQSGDNLLVVKRRAPHGTWSVVPGLSSITGATSVFVACHGENIIVAYTDGAGVKAIVWNAASGSWGNIITLSTDTSARNVTGGRVANNRLILLWTTGASSPYAVQSHTLHLNAAPQEAGVVVSSAAIDAAVGVDITIQHNDPDGDQMGAWALRRRWGINTEWWSNSTKAWVANEVYNVGSGTSVTIPAADNAGKWQSGVIYQLAASTRDSSGETGPYTSTPVVLNVGAAPQVIVTGPTGTVRSGSADVTWTCDVATSAHRVRLLQGQTVVFDSGKVTGSNIRALTVTGLQDGQTYTPEVTVWDTTAGGGVPSQPTTGAAFSVSYTRPLPAMDVMAAGKAALAAVKLRWRRGFSRPGTFARSSPAYLPDGTEVPTGQPRYYGGGIMVEEPTQNLLTANQSSAETDLSGVVGNYPEVTVARDTTASVHGSASFRVTAPSEFRGLRVTGLNLTPGTYTFSVYLRGRDGGEKVQLAHTAGTGGPWTGSSQQFTLTTSFQRFAYTFTVDTSGPYVLEIGSVETSAEITFYADCLQLEAKPYATSWTLGGTTRAAETLTVPIVGWEKGDWQVSFDYTPSYHQDIPGTSRPLWRIYIDADNVYHLMVHSTGRPYLEVRANGINYNIYSAADPVLQAGVTYRLTARGDGENIALFINGVLSAGGKRAYTEPSGQIPSVMYVGISQAGGAHANGIYGPLHISRAMTDEEIAEEFARGMRWTDKTIALHTWANTLEGGTQEAVFSHWGVERLESGAWRRIAEVANPDTGEQVEYTDYAVGSGRPYQYRVVAYGSNGTETPGEPVTAGVVWEGWRFTPLDDPASEIRFAWDWSARRNLDEDRQEIRTRGRYPITFRGPSKPVRLDIAAAFDADGGLTAREWAQRIYALSGTLGYLRSPDGDIWFGELYAPNDDWQRDLVANGRVVRVQFVEKGPVPVAV